MTALKIATINVNGIRAAFRKGMADWVNSANPDVMALQEVRAETSDLNSLLAEVGGLAHNVVVSGFNRKDGPTFI